jgi:diaminopimelate epimerase
MPHPLVRISKYQALGNSYLVLDPRDIQGTLRELFERTPPLAMQRPKAAVVRSLCDMSTGIGSNGLLFGPLRLKGLFGVLVINSDGTTAGFSGNGSRIFAQYLLDTGDIGHGQTIEVAIPEEHTGRPLSMNLVRIRMPEDGGGPIEVSAPHVPRFGAAAVGASDALKPKTVDSDRPSLCYFFPALADVGTKLMGTKDIWNTSVLLDIGNPHCVTFVGDPRQLPDFTALRACDYALRAISFRMDEAGAVFADGANLQWAWPESRTRLRLSIYERGEGPTPASGSSACAAACAAYALDLVEERLDVIMPGGTLAISVEGPRNSIKSVTLAGFAAKILEGIAILPAQTSS